MFNIKKYWVRVLCLIIFLVYAFQGFTQVEKNNGFDCFSIMVGKNASTDGSVLFAHNEDDYGLQLVNFYKVPRQQNASDDSIMLKNGGKLDQVWETNAYLWLEMPNMSVSDGYINEWGVAIASDQCSSREKEPDLTDGGVIYWLRRAVTERAKSAKQGVKIAGDLIETYGYASSGRTYLIADANEGWMLAAVHGKHWMAQRIPDDHVAVIPNYYTIGEIDLADTTNFLGSADIIDYAVQKGWYNSEQDGAFHFAKAYASPRSLESSGNINRMWRGVTLISQHQFDVNDEFPFSLKPKEKIAVQDLMRVMRDHYEGTEFDNSQHYKLGNPYELNRSTICSPTNQFGFIAQLRSWMPKEIGTLVWIAPRRPDSQAFIPWYVGITEAPENYAYLDHQEALKVHFDPPEFYYDKSKVHAFWTFVELAEWVDEDYKNRIAKIREVWDKLEKILLEQQVDFEDQILGMYQKEPQKARALLTEYTIKWAKKAYEEANQLKSK